MNRIPWDDPNLPHGERGGYRKITVTFPQSIYERLIQESASRKIAGEPNHMVSALLREAVSLYLDHLESANGETPKA